MKSLVFMAVASLVAASSVAQVKVDMKAGLWQNSIKFEGGAQGQLAALQKDQADSIIGDMQEQLKNMPPEQRKMMEDALAASKAQAGQLPEYQNEHMSLSKDGVVTKDCITQAEIDKGWVPESEDGCKSTVTAVGKNKFKLHQVCEGEGASSMDAEVEFSSTTKFTGTGTAVQNFNGQRYTMPVALEGKWLASECGAIKPRTN